MFYLLNIKKLLSTFNGQLNENIAYALNGQPKENIVSVCLKLEISHINNFFLQNVTVSL